MHIVPNVYNVRIGILVFASLALRLKRYSVLYTVDLCLKYSPFYILIYTMYVLDDAWIMGIV